MLSLLAVQVRADATGDPAWDVYNQSTVNFLPSSSWYLVAAATDNWRVAAAFRSAGLPIAVARVAKTTDYSGAEKTDSFTVDPGRGHYTLTTSTRLTDPFVHNHDWTFWHGAARSRSGFVLHLHGMTDSSCGYYVSPAVDAIAPECGARLVASPRTRAARLFGETRETPYAFNHPASADPWGYIILVRKGRVR